MIDQVLSQWQYVNFPLVSHQRLELYSQCPWANNQEKLLASHLDNLQPLLTGNTHAHEMETHYSFQHYPNQVSNIWKFWLEDDNNVKNGCFMTEIYDIRD